MENFKIENLTFTYPSSDSPVLKNINLTTQKGQFITLCGKSGCGKTTLLRLLKSSLSPHGKLCGSISFCGKALCDIPRKEECSKIGFVLQDPDNQNVTDKVWHELAFGAESLGLPTEQIRARVAETASFFGIESLFLRNVSELSGGQKQLLALASVMVLQPSVLILDEPTAQLDPIASHEFLGMLKKINRELGTHIILSEHRLEEAFGISDRVIVMDNGEIIADGTPGEVCSLLHSASHPMAEALPVPARAYLAVSHGKEAPVTVAQGKNWLEDYAYKNPLCPENIIKKPPFTPTETVIEVKEAYFRYQKDSPDIVKGLSLKVSKGEFFTILGGNGTGKTTSLSILGGLLKPYRGEVLIKGKKISAVKDLCRGMPGILPQNPRDVFSEKTVYLDLMTISSDKAAVYDIAELCDIAHLLNRHPYDLSGGEMQRAALAKVLLTEPEILLLDEPTKGMDADFKNSFADILCELKSRGVTIIAVSHDVEFCAKYADRCALFFDGNTVSTGEPREFFASKSFYTTAANRMAREILPQAVLCEDIILACGKTPPSPPKREKNAPVTSEPQNDSFEITNRPLSKRTLFSLLPLIVTLPLTILFGIRFLDDRKYYFISILIILQTLIPFILAFEKRKPKACELIIISVLCALGIAGRNAFYALPQFKPTAALVIIAGVSLGSETGFLVGVVTAFVSNIFFGQGPWTPWQMLALGLIGLVSGLVFRQKFIKPSRLTLSVFGAACALILYGGIMNPASVLIWQNRPTPQMILTAMAAGIPFDLIHAAATAFFLWFISRPLTEKLERVKTKYGLLM